MSFMLRRCADKGKRIAAGVSRVAEGLMRCPVCHLELGVERRADEVVLTYSFTEWGQHCRCRAGGSPALCDELKRKLLTLLTNGKAPPSPRGEQRRG
jgi:hypothetical protein